MKEIERKIEENKIHAKHIKNGTEKVPKWSRPQFDDKVLFLLMIQFCVCIKICYLFYFFDI